MENKDLNPEDIKNAVIIIALDNLIKSCNISLEDKEITQNEREYFETLVYLSSEIKSDISTKVEIPKVTQRPIWGK